MPTTKELYSSPRDYAKNEEIKTKKKFKVIAHSGLYSWPVLSVYMFF